MTKRWQPRKLLISPSFAEYMRQEGLELKAIHITGEEEDGKPTEPVLELRPTLEDDVKTVREIVRAMPYALARGVALRKLARLRRRRQ